MVNSNWKVLKKVREYWSEYTRIFIEIYDDGPNNGGAWDRYEDVALYCIEYVLDNLI